MNDWIDIKKQLPQPNQNVLGWNNTIKEWELATMVGDILPLDVWGRGWDYNHEITHWLPLPIPPLVAEPSLE